MTDAIKKKYSITTTDLYDHSHSFIVETSEKIEEYVKKHIFNDSIAYANWIESPEPRGP